MIRSWSLWGIVTDTKQEDQENKQTNKNVPPNLLSYGLDRGRRSTRRQERPASQLSSVIQLFFPISSISVSKNSYLQQLQNSIYWAVSSYVMTHSTDNTAHSQTFDGNRTQCTFDTPRLNPNNISSQMIIQLLWLIKPTYKLWPLFISVVLTFLLWYFY